MMNSIFVTGGSSAIGQCVINQLLEKRYGVTALTHRQSLPADFPVKTVTGSILDPESYKEAVREAQVILHLAGLSHSNVPKQYDDVNTEGTRRLLGACAPNAFFVYLSTRCTHPDGGEYAVSKLRAEKAVISSGLRYAIVRPAEAYGTKAIEGIDSMLQFAIRYRFVWDFHWNGAAASYAPVSSEEVAEFLVKVAEHPRRDKATYTLCAERSWTANDICRELSRFRRCRYFVLPIPVRWLLLLLKIRIPMPFERDQIARLIVSKSSDLSAARMDYGFNPRPFNEYIHTVLLQTPLSS